MVNRDKKFIINEGRTITNGKFAYGGFPRVLSEEGGATEAFRDDNLGDQATKPNEVPLSREELRAQLEKMQQNFYDTDHNLSDDEYMWSRSSDGRRARAEIFAMQQLINDHPESVKEREAREAEIAAKEAAREERRRINADMDFHKMGKNIDDVVDDSFGYRRAPEIDSDEVAGRNRGPVRLPPTVPELGIGPDDARRRR